jgi:hypothetical protein
MLSLIGLKPGTMPNKEPYNLNGIPVEKLADLYYSDFEKIENQFPPGTSLEVKILVHDKLFNKRYLKTNKKGEKYWKI